MLKLKWPCKRGKRNKPLQVRMVSERVHHQKRGIKWFQEDEKERANQSGGSPQCKSKETEVEVRANARAEIWGDARARNWDGGERDEVGLEQGYIEGEHLALQWPPYAHMQVKQLTFILNATKWKQKQASIYPEIWICLGRTKASFSLVWNVEALG